METDDEAVLDRSGDPVHEVVLDLTTGAQAPARRVGGLPAVDAMHGDTVLSVAADHGWPCVPLRPGLTILGTPWAWRTFLETAVVEDREAARAYLDALPSWED